ncbi:helix-turn-helix transcriptional regulator [Streptococcus uberis]|uniref:helix-turn-helix transcriptional regulator n=1 Tax=Streptococcus uberis TaxID=1349 RepID=UPI0012B640CA|nr:helix-turn-helix transcriptional regulator [Streptococcus uberis]MTB38012.1 helix-turn-helix domain-containing protein [Streptococcus uberis]MTB55158.1 helix-turn-helix domain-containing protein [Streptococcus uberis]MTB60966.1 helix-turn-helix domain-containing protein [Streptococcus uberis]
MDNKNSNRIKELRKQKKLTQKQLAKKIGVASLSISRWENGERTPKPDMARLLANEFDVTIPYLLGYDVQIDDAEQNILPQVVELLELKYKDYYEQYNQAKTDLHEKFLKLTSKIGTLSDINPESKEPIFFRDYLLDTSQLLLEILDEASKIDKISQILLEIKDKQMENIIIVKDFERLKKTIEDLK